MIAARMRRRFTRSSKWSSRMFVPGTNQEFYRETHRIRAASFLHRFDKARTRKSLARKRASCHFVAAALRPVAPNCLQSPFGQPLPPVLSESRPRVLLAKS
jgi:hypothetical protein